MILHLFCYFFLIIKNNDELKECIFNQTKILTSEVFLNLSIFWIFQNIFSTSRICLFWGFIEMRTSRTEGPVNNQINAESHKYYSYCRNEFFQNLFLTFDFESHSELSIPLCEHHRNKNLPRLTSHELKLECLSNWKQI